jgi:hypothetical protein
MAEQSNYRYNRCQAQRAALKMQINRATANAVGIARIMQCGWYKEVRIKGLDSHAIEALLVSRALLVKIKQDLGTRSVGSSEFWAHHRPSEENVFARVLPSGRRSAGLACCRSTAEGGFSFCTTEGQY